MSISNDFAIRNGVLKKYKGPGGDVTIPDGVTTIGDSAFFDCNSLISITIPDSVTSLGCNAFYGCTSLTSVTIPDSVTTIGESAFDECTSLQKINLPKGLTCLESDTFRGCNALTELDIPERVTRIGDEAFAFCTCLTSITIPDSVTSIGDGTFSGCKHLTSVTVPNSVTSIGDMALAFCNRLTSIAIPDSVTDIGYGAFWGSLDLENAAIPESRKNRLIGVDARCRASTVVKCDASIQYQVQADLETRLEKLMKNTCGECDGALVEEGEDGVLKIAYPDDENGDEYVQELPYLLEKLKEKYENLAVYGIGYECDAVPDRMTVPIFFCTQDDASLTILYCYLE